MKGCLAQVLLALINIVGMYTHTYKEEKLCLKIKFKSQIKCFIIAHSDKKYKILVQLKW